MNPIEEARKKNRKKQRIQNYITIAGGVVMAAIVVGILVFYIWIWAKYGNTPYGEVPAWVNWVMGRK